MKRRIDRLNSLDTRISTVAHNSIRDVATVRTTPFPFCDKTQRRGQALLLAVLIMLLAALLGAGFLGVVSSNLNQTARIADKTRAIEASRAGIAFANAQLSGSSQGDLWRPIDVSPAPAPGAANYDFYYSQLDKIQGWASTAATPVRSRFATELDYQIALKSYRDSTYGKFPDPGQIAGDTPRFLVKVEEVAPNSLGDAGHGGEIKITSIGLSDDDPNVFHRSIAYKSGRRKSPWAEALRSVSNWKFGNSDKNTGVPYATKPQLVNATTFPANNVDFAVDVIDKPLFSNDDVPFNVVIIKKAGAPSVRGAVVTKVDNNGAKLTFARLEKTIGADETIQKAAALGIGSTIDLLNTGTPEPYAKDLPQANGILANGSVWLQGPIQLSNLSRNSTRISVSGSLAIDDDDTKKKLVAQSGDVGAPAMGNANSNKIVPSSQPNFPGDLVLTSTAQSDGVKTTDLINDGWNNFGVQTLGLDYSGGRAVEPFAPARIDSPGNLARYRALTRNSADGIYIDNRDDIERVDAVAMTQQKLVEMLISPNAAPKDYERTGVAALAGATNVSLEQRHLRGWIGPDEFLARGVLVEISSAIGPDGKAPSLRITRDARSDANPDGPDINQTWRKADGTPDNGVYAKSVSFPLNGTLMAAGNVRIRGNVGGTPAPRSLTVISLGNIYIEGSLSLDNTFLPDGVTPDPARKKLMLLARKNVIVNPTRAVIGRTDAATIATNTAAVPFTGTTSAKTLSVANSLLFNKGDYVTIGSGQNKSLHGLITAVDTTNNRIDIVSRDVFTVAATAPGSIVNVRSLLEARAFNAPANTADKIFFSLVKVDNTPGSVENVINRRILVPFADNATPSLNKLIFDHGADLKRNAGSEVIGLNIRAEDASAAFPRPTTPAFIAELTNKQPLKAAPVGSQDAEPKTDSVANSDKVLRLHNNYTPNNRQQLPSPVALKTMEQFRMEISQVTEQRATPDEGYKYVATLVDFTEAGTNPALSIGKLPYYALAGVGLRYEIGDTFVAPSTLPINNRRKNFNTAQGYTIPLATSVEIDLNSKNSYAIPDSQAAVMKQFGFAPTIGSGDAEDVMSVDRSFYQPSDLALRSTVDSRILDFSALAVGNTVSSLVLRRAAPTNTTAIPLLPLLPDYRLRALKYEYADLNRAKTQPVADTLQINAFVYAQEGSWLIIPGDYFRARPPVRGIMDATTKALRGSYIDYNNDNRPDANEFIYDGVGAGAGRMIADLNRNGVAEDGELNAALRFHRYNPAPIQFLGAIAENQTAVVGDVAAVAMNTPPIIRGAVQEWTDKWASYKDAGLSAGGLGTPEKWAFIKYIYDSSLADGSVGANELRVPVTDALLYEQ